VTCASLSSVTAEVRPLAPEEARDDALVETLAGLINAAYAAGEQGLWIDGTTRTGPGEIAEAIRKGTVLAATRDGRLVGCAYLSRVDARTADLGFVSAAPDEWGTGVGGELVRSAEAHARTNGTKTMQLELLVPKEWVHPEKARLRSWYLRLGYGVVRTAPIDEVAAHLAPQLATPCEFLIFRKRLTEL
jgi:GNAT superfamily N-acetyltransferase